MFKAILLYDEYSYLVSKDDIADQPYGAPKQT